LLRINLTCGFHTWVEPSRVAELRDILRRPSSLWRLRGPAGMAADALTLYGAVLLSTGFMKAGAGRRGPEHSFANSDFGEAAGDQQALAAGGGGGSPGVDPCRQRRRLYGDQRHLRRPSA
jgi:hypothetical protein